MSNGMKLVSLKDIRLVSPDLFICNEGYNLTSNKKLLNGIFYNIGLNGFKFSSKLYDIDNKYWESLTANKYSDSEYAKSSYAVVDENNTIITVVNEVNKLWLDELTKHISNLKDENKYTTVSLPYSNGEGFSSMFLEEGSDKGFVLLVDILNQKIQSRDIYYKDDLISISDNNIINISLSNDDKYDIASLLDTEILTRNDYPQEFFSDYINRLKYLKMSYSESYELLKTVFNIKIKSKISDYSSYLTNNELDKLSDDNKLFLNNIISKIYDKGYQFIPTSSYLERKLKFIDVSYYEVIKELFRMYLRGFVPIYSLIRFTSMINNNSSDYEIVTRSLNLSKI